MLLLLNAPISALRKYCRKAPPATREYGCWFSLSARAWSKLDVKEAACHRHDGIRDVLVSSRGRTFCWSQYSRCTCSNPTCNPASFVSSKVSVDPCPCFLTLGTRREMLRHMGAPAMPLPLYLLLSPKASMSIAPPRSSTSCRSFFLQLPT
jgi:hypothetical protein